MTEVSHPHVSDRLLELLLERRSLAYDPWADLGRRNGVDLCWHTGKEMGLTRFSELRISLRVGMTAPMVRTTLTHELIHLERGPEPRPWRRRADELIVRTLTAKRLVDPVLYDALVRADRLTVSTAEAVLEVDRWDLENYVAWRARVSDRTAHRAWDTAQQLPAWLPRWLYEPPLKEWAHQAGYQRSQWLAGLSTAPPSHAARLTPVP